MDTADYIRWRKTKLEHCPRSEKDLLVDIDGLHCLDNTGKALILEKCRRFNMAIYRCRDDFVDRAAVKAFARNFGLQRVDHHLCANEDGVSELSVAHRGNRGDYVPYSNRGLSWHTDGYYNGPSHRVRAVLLHCSVAAASGGENALFDPDMAYIRLRDEDPRFITALEHPECMTIPANEGSEGQIRPEVTGPVFSYEDNGAIHMRYSARKKNIRWRDDALTRAARDYLTTMLDEENGLVLRYRLRPGEGLLSNNVLHNRTAFENGAGQGRLLYRARFFDRTGTG